ncbi:MAG: fatty acid desaturase [Mycobacterium sp.]
MPESTTPTDPDPPFLEFIEKSDAIAGEKLAAAIPREYMQPSVARGFAGLAVSWSLYVGAIVGIAVLDRWYLVVPLVVIAGLGGWGLHCIAHDCGHGSFSRNRRLNFAIGHLALLPLLYPFHSWRHVHNLHHAHTMAIPATTLVTCSVRLTASSGESTQLSILRHLKGHVGGGPSLH